MCSSHPKPTESLAQARSIYHRSSLAQVKLKQVRFGGGQVEAGQVWLPSSLAPVKFSSRQVLLGSDRHGSSLARVKFSRVKFALGQADTGQVWLGLSSDLELLNF